MAVDLSKVDLVRDRMRCSYEEAQNALVATNGDVVSALARLEKDQSAGADIGGLVTQLVDDVQNLLEAGGAIRRLRVRVGDHVVREFPLELTAVGAILVAALAVVASRLVIDVIRD